MHQYSFNEEKIIDFIFDNKNKIKKIDKTFFYENKIKPKRIYNEYGGPIDKIKDAGEALKTTGIDKLKNMVKSVTKNLVSFGAFRVICKQIAKALNKDPATKKAAFNQIKAKYNDSVTVTSFFLKSTYSLFLMKGYKEFYSWELAMACIMIYESEGISEVWNSVRGFNVNSLEKITEFKEKIDSKQLTINTDTTINDSGRSLNVDKDKTKETTDFETETEGTETPEEIKKIVTKINLVGKVDINGIKNSFNASLSPKSTLTETQKRILTSISKTIKDYGDINSIPISSLTDALKLQEEAGISFKTARIESAYKIKDTDIIFNIDNNGRLALKEPRPSSTSVDLSKLIKDKTEAIEVNKVKLKLSLLLIYTKIRNSSPANPNALSFFKEIIKNN